MVDRNRDLDHGRGPRTSAVVVSERDSDSVDTVASIYGWRPYYYFFHGWAALDWYRGYDKCFLIAPPEDRQISRTIISPNRIIGGKRDHRVLLMYHLLRNKIRSSYTSFPAVCPVEQVTVADVAGKWLTKYPDITSTLEQAGLPWHMPNENDHPMHSCWLSLFDQCAETLAYVVNETVYFGRRNHLTEKTFKPICLQMPFIMVSAAGSLEYLRSYGFKTFDSVWNEDYDQETDDLLRMEKIARLIKELDDLSPGEKQQIHRHVAPAVVHNFQHFYGADFSHILWQELLSMFHQMRQDRG